MRSSFHALSSFFEGIRILVPRHWQSLRHCGQGTGFACPDGRRTASRQSKQTHVALPPRNLVSPIKHLCPLACEEPSRYPAIKPTPWRTGCLQFPLCWADEGAGIDKVGFRHLNAAHGWWFPTVALPGYWQAGRRDRRRRRPVLDRAARRLGRSSASIGRIVPQSSSSRGLSWCAWLP